MALLLSVDDIIDVGRVSTYLSANYTAKKSLFGGSLVKPQPPVQIAYITDALNWGVEGGAETDDENRQMANYLYWLCGMFQLQAQYIINGAGGGSVVPTPSGGASVNDLDFIVSASTIIATGESSIYFDGTSGNPDFRGLNVNFARGAGVQYTTPDPDGTPYYAWNKVTGFFQLLSTDVNVDPSAQAGERFRIMPDTGGSAASVSTLAPSVTVLPGQWADAVTLNLQYIVDAGEVALFVSGYNSNFLVAPTDFTYTATGLVMTDSNFNSANFPFTLIMKIN